MGAWGVPGAAHRSTAEWLSCRHATESGLVVPCMGAAAGSVRTCPISRGPNPNPSPSSSPSPSPCPNPNPNSNPNPTPNPNQVTGHGHGVAAHASQGHLELTAKV